MGKQRLRLGRRGESCAARCLRRAGLRVLGRNVRTRAGELDLVCLDADTLVFVEVRTVGSPGGPADARDAVTPTKVRQVVRAARAWLETRAGRRLASRALRFDAVVVDARAGTVAHLPDAFAAAAEEAFFC